jgi:hypothetical protein
MLFATTQLRATFPGAPEFGTTLDYYGILPCLVILAFCAGWSIFALTFIHDIERENRDNTFSKWLDRRIFNVNARDVDHRQANPDARDDFLNVPIRNEEDPNAHDANGGDNDIPLAQLRGNGAVPARPAFG